MHLLVVGGSTTFGHLQPELLFLTIRIGVVETGVETGDDDVVWEIFEAIEEEGDNFLLGFERKARILW